MKVSKSLLSAMLVGLTVSVTSCTKEPGFEVHEEETNPKVQKEAERTCGNEGGQETHPFGPGDCPACGMG